MIPQRIKLSGFLSYKTEQEICLDGSHLWMLSGANGSGKSSVFDAVTFALFGHHRGGSQSAAELINKESTTLAVEFDFLVDQVCYRIVRTVRQLQKSLKSTLQAYRQEPDGKWQAIPDTEHKTKFDAWVRDKIGLDYETFTSSVVLLQGKAEKLLDSTPAGRAGVLARIVDLERYQRLHSKADDERRERKGSLEEIENQLGVLPEVKDEQLTDAQARIATAEQARAESQERVAKLQALELQALRWTESQSRLTATRDKLRNMESLLEHAVAIEKQYTRLRELHDVLPVVGTIVTERGRIGESDRKTEQYLKEQESRANSRQQVAHALDQGKKKLAAHKQTLATNEAQKSRLDEKLRELTAAIEKVKQAEDAEAEIKRLEVELKPLPANPDDAVRTLQAEKDRLGILAQNVAVLERLHQERSELARAVDREKKARAEEEKLKADGTKAKKDHEAAEAKLKAARGDREAKDIAAAGAKALAENAKQLADEFKQMTGEKSCRACGQPLSAKHFGDEKKRRQDALKAAEEKSKSLAAEAAAALKLETDLIAKEAAAREHLHKLRDQFRDAAAALRQAGTDIYRLTESCRQSYFALPDEFKSRVAAKDPPDWAKVTFPDRHDIDNLAADVRRLDALKKKLATAQEQAKKAADLRAKLESARERHARAKQALPAGNAATVREDYSAREAEAKALDGSIAATKKNISTTEIEVDRSQRELGQIDNALTELKGKLALEESSRKQSHETVERSLKSLPAAWRGPAETSGFNEHIRWKEEYEKLTEEGVESKFTQLQAARSGLESLRAEIATLEREADEFPEESRRSPDDVKAEIAAAQAELKARDSDLFDAQAAKRELDRLREQRAELTERFKAADLEHSRYKTLAELLGRNRLQRHLVRTAERQIVDCANGMLDRLSAGQLFLRLIESDAGTDKALELECYNRVTGEAPVNVNYLSGSQKFRVAVSLALGIGQYASKQHRPIESVMIDEGFGCLDRNGRQVMIQELQNLRGHLRCILLVSHQEEFADAFPDGYRFELIDGSTKVSSNRR
jgi:DNA repair exonuclease SbcCD ATPase subunit